MARRAAAEGARLLVTPEMSLTGYHLGPRRVRELAALPLLDAVHEISRDEGIEIVAGLPELRDGRVHNAVSLAGKTYRKTHLFGDIDRDAFTAGDEIVVQTELDGVTIGLLICYDVEFPETVRAHALAGTQLLLVPTALMRPWEFVARSLVPTRAFENQLHIAYTNWVGREQELQYCGLSRVVAPDGSVLAELGGDEGLLFAEIDTTLTGGSTYLTDMRRDLYQR